MKKYFLLALLAMGVFGAATAVQAGACSGKGITGEAYAQCQCNNWRGSSWCLGRTFGAAIKCQPGEIYNNSATSPSCAPKPSSRTGRLKVAPSPFPSAPSTTQSKMTCASGLYLYQGSCMTKMQYCNELATTPDTLHHVCLPPQAARVG